MEYAIQGKYPKDHSEHLKIVLKFILSAFCVGAIFLLISSKAFFAPAGAISSNMPQMKKFDMNPPLEVGPKTSELMANLQNEGLAPKATVNIQRDFFSAMGIIVTLNGDNIKVFEYKDPATAAADVLAFQKSAETKMYAWRKTVHLYLKDNIIVFYMGSRRNILDALKNRVGEPVLL